MNHELWEPEAVFFNLMEPLYESILALQLINIIYAIFPYFLMSEVNMEDDVS